MDLLLAKLLPTLVLPPGLALVLLVAGLAGRGRRWGPWLSGAGIALLWVASMPLVSRHLSRSLEERALRLSPAEIPKGDVILVLGGGLRPPLPPRRGVEVGEAGDRLLTGVDLMRKGKAPWLLVSGDQVSFTAGGSTPAEALSAARLATWLGVPADRIVRSENPRNTAEEARALQELARRRRWRRVLLVTSAAHLPRSVATFRRLTDLTVVPVACDFQTTEPGSIGRPTFGSVLMDLMPSAAALSGTSEVLREVMGLAVYRLRGWG
ncbi:MAG: YdcF family protein [Synechococcaceae cyanobacterium]|nr:YdcF family protein [Synechococcaceae cyanobacterium]